MFDGRCWVWIGVGGCRGVMSSGYWLGKGFLVGFYSGLWYEVDVGSGLEFWLGNGFGL